jgi:Universal stress protein family
MVEEDILAMDADGDIDGMCGELLRREDYLMSEQMKILIAYDGSAWMSRTIDAMAAPLHKRGLAVSSVIRACDPKHVLLDEAEHWRADGLFVGARGLSRVERFLLGSVSAAVAARAPCSVEVVRTA